MNTKSILGVIIGITLVITLGVTIPMLSLQRAEALAEGHELSRKAAPAAISGENVYVVWPTNNTANNNEEIMFRASTDGGITFGDKINLSNTTNADSTRAEIDSDADSVVITWWETNQIGDIPVARISTDAGQTFGSVLMLATNGTLNEVEDEEPEEGE
jgi:hypothetical protein